MKIVWIVLAAAVLLSPAAASSAGFDDDCPAPTSQSNPPFMYDRGPLSQFRDSEGHVRLNVSCTQETIHWVVMSNDPSNELDGYRVEYTCLGVEGSKKLAECDDGTLNGTLLWADVNATTCRFYGAYRTISQRCYLIENNLTVSISECQIPDPVMSSSMPSISSVSKTTTPPDSSQPTTTPSPPIGPTTSRPSPGIQTYIPVVVVIFGFLVLIAAAGIGIAIFKYKSYRTKLYNSHVYFIQEVDPKFNPIVIHSSVTISRSMETIFHSLEVDYYEKDFSEVQSQTDISPLVSAELSKAESSDLKPVVETEAENDGVAMIQQDNKNMGQTREIHSESSCISKSGYVTEQVKKADTGFDLNDEADECSLTLGHSPQRASSDSEVAVVMTSNSGGYIYNDSSERSVVLQNTMHADSKKAAQSGDSYIQSLSSESSGYVTEQSGKVDTDVSDSGCSLNNGESLQFMSYDSKMTVVANFESSGYVTEQSRKVDTDVSDSGCSLNNGESLQFMSYDSEMTVVANFESSGYVTEQSRKVDTDVSDSGCSLNNGESLQFMSYDSEMTVVANFESSGYVTEQSRKVDTDVSDSGCSLNNGESLQFMSYDSEMTVVANSESSGYVYNDSDEQPETLLDRQCSSSGADERSNDTVAMASSGYVAEASNGYIQRLRPRVTESDAEPLVPAVCITLEDDTYMSSEEVGVEFEPLMSESNLNKDRQMSTSDTDGYVYSSQVEANFDHQNSMSTSSGYIYGTDESANVTTSDPLTDYIYS